MVRILSFVGTRPEIIKSLAFHRAAKNIPELEILFLHTGQNFGQTMADCFWEGLEIPLTESNPNFKHETPGAIAGSLLDYMTSKIDEYKPDVVISNTDTHSAFYAAMAAANRKVPVAHFEGGIRCEVRTNPEEINRRLADHLSDWIFPIADGDVQFLINEGISKDKIFNLGDITLDALNIVLKEHDIVPQSGDYDLLTTHRQENTNDPKRLARILKGVADAGHKTVFPVHPRTRQMLDSGLPAEALKQATNIEILPPQGYVDMVRLAAGCRKVITDSGGLRREAYMLGKPVISLVWFVWFKEMLKLGFKKSVSADSEKITDAILNFNPQGERPPLFGDGNAAERILRKIIEKVSDEA